MSDHIFIIEDQQVVSSFLIEALGMEGYSTSAAVTAAEAWACFEIQKPSLVILDLMLPGQSGLDFLRARRRDPEVSCIPVVVISAASRDLLREAKNLGADACVGKPFDLDALTAVVKSLLSNELAGDSGGDRPNVVWACSPDHRHELLANPAAHPRA